MLPRRYYGVAVAVFTLALMKKLGMTCTFVTVCLFATILHVYFVCNAQMQLILRALGVHYLLMMLTIFVNNNSSFSTSDVK